MNAKRLRAITNRAKVDVERSLEAWWRSEIPKILLRLERDAQDGKDVSKIYYETKCPKFVLKELKIQGFKASVRDVAGLRDGYVLKVEW